MAGLRGEYTHTYGRNGTVAQDYLSLFPNANLSWKMTEDGSGRWSPSMPGPSNAPILVPHPPADAGLGLHLPDRKPAAKPRL